MNLLKFSLDVLMAQGSLAMDNLQFSFICKTGFVIAEGDFLSYCNHQLIKFEENMRFGL